MVLIQLLPRKIAPRIIASWTIAPWIITLPGQLHSRIIALEESSSRTVAPEDNCLPENCPLSIKFLPKIIAPTQVNSSQRALRVS